MHACHLPLAAASLEPFDGSLDQFLVHGMDLDTMSDRWNERYSQLAAQMLLEIGDPHNDAPVPTRVPEVERIVPEREPERLQQPDNAEVFTLRQQAGEHRIPRVKRNADRHRLAMAQGVARERLELVGRPVTEVQGARGAAFEGVAATRDLAHMEICAAQHQRLERV